jgi:hypothetical protein
MPDGSPLDTPAVVNLYTFSGAPAGIGVFRSGTAEFTNLAPASYKLEIVAAGYQHLTENVEIYTSGEHQQISVFLTPESTAPAASSAPGSPILAPNAEKEAAKALEDLRATKRKTLASIWRKSRMRRPHIRTSVICGGCTTPR